MAHELQPFVLIRVADEVAHCATWQMETGHEALVLFSTEQKAVAYARTLIESAWQVHHPARPGLTGLLEQSQQANILYAVLDPDPEQQTVHQVFDIPQVLAAAGSLGDSTAGP